MITERLHRRLLDTDDPKSFSARARARRWTELLRCFPELSELRVLDLGGLPEFWRTAPVRPARVVTVNLTDADAPEPWLRHVVGDACAPVAPRGERFDLVVSNSLLEHVGGHERRRRLAEVVHAAADRHWVQTPNRYFPVEPHWACPGLQFLPVPLRAAVVRRWPLGHARITDRVAATEAVLATELVSACELRLLFPGSRLWRERVAGLTKSLVAVRG